MQFKQKKVIGIASLLLILAIVSIAVPGLVSQICSNPSMNSRLLYNLYGKTFFADVYVFYPNGELKKLSPSDSGIYYQPHINPQGNKVVFYGSENGPPRIWMANIETGRAAALTPETSGARHPVFSWDGSMIAFASDRSYHQNPERIELMRGNGLPPEELVLHLFIMDTNGKNVRQITFGPYQDQRPAFSPDGKTLAFVSNRGSARGLWTVQIDGNHEPRPLQMDGWGYRPWYSPDGQWIYFFTSIKNRHQICKISINGGQIFSLPNDDSGTSHGPFVDYDNATMLLHSNRNGKFGIWELPLDGTEPRQVMLPDLEEMVAHATRSKNGIIAFDVCRRTLMRKIGSSIEEIAFAMPR
jgi:Tol biopolymer transport system component